jgi:hypothetical protein
MRLRSASHSSRTEGPHHPDKKVDLLRSMTQLHVGKFLIPKGRGVLNEGFW